LTSGRPLGHRRAVISNVWLKRDGDFDPGAELFRSERTFSLLAYVRSHGQLLLSSDRSADNESNETTIQICFKPIEAVQIQDCYRGLVIRCATPVEAEQIRESVPDFGYRNWSAPVFVLESQGAEGYVVSSAMGWREGHLSRLQPSFYNSVTPDDSRWPTGPLGGYNGRADEASPAEVVQAFITGLGQGARRDRYRYVHVLMANSEDHDGRNPVGVFLTEADAREAEELLRPHVSACWIEISPMVL
jgi:hypothetical protein